MARDPKRIDQILDRLRRVWKQYPDLRLVQLLKVDDDYYYSEDYDFILKIEKFFQKEEDHG